MRWLSGICASSGIAIGPVFLYLPDLPSVPVNPIEAEDDEIERLESAVTQVEAALAHLKDLTVEKTGAEEAQIFEAHALFLQDPAFTGEIIERIRSEKINAERAVELVMQNLQQTFLEMENEYFRARADDVVDVGYRLIRTLLNLPQPDFQSMKVPSIVLARDLLPSDTALMDSDLVLGFATIGGGQTSHVAILARSLGIPALVAVEEALVDIEPQTPCILDGLECRIGIDPDETTLTDFRDRKQRHEAVFQEARKRARDPAVTKDGKEVEVVANIGQIAEAEQAVLEGAEGVGLLRTEFLFLDRSEEPSEDEQVECYRSIAEAVGDDPLVVRTLDIGGDKPCQYISVEQEDNPFLGLRGVRLSLSLPDLFKTQLRALLRAASGQNIKIMFPMVSTVPEVQQAKSLLDEAAAELKSAGQDYGAVEVGIMVETPAAAVMADRLAEQVDFFSIGTNDLTQYVMAADRGNAHIQHLIDAFNPAVLRLIDQVIRCAHAAGKWVGLCGELAGDPLAVPLLLGMSLDEFSMGKASIPLVKQEIRMWSLPEARVALEACLQLDDGSMVRNYLKEARSGK
jgi:phosphoenolpyruvate-protein phosphotransferase